MPEIVPEIEKPPPAEPPYSRTFVCGTYDPNETGGPHAWIKLDVDDACGIVELREIEESCRKLYADRKAELLESEFDHRICGYVKWGVAVGYAPDVDSRDTPVWSLIDPEDLCAVKGSAGPTSRMVIDNFGVRFRAGDDLETPILEWTVIHLMATGQSLRADIRKASIFKAGE